MEKGFDISAWQEDYFTVDRMKQAKDEGNTFVIVKLGESFREDEYARYNIFNALNAGLKVGVYYFSHAYDEQTAQRESDWVVAKLAEIGLVDYHLQAGIWYDYEDHRQLRNMLNTNALTQQGMTNCMSIFVNTLMRAGHSLVGIYSGYSLLWDETFAYSQMPWVPIWVAQYNKTCDYPNPYYWQYSESGTVAGATVDVNYKITGQK